MILDLCAHIGPWPRRPIGLDAQALWERLAPFGVTRIYAGRTEALWFENPHDANRLAEASREVPPGVVSIPVLDPTLADWREELDRLMARGPVAMVRLYPNYHGYALKDVDPVLDALARRKIIAQVVVRMDDPRRQHPLAQVADVAPPTIREAAAKHPTLRVLLTGAQNPALVAMTRQLADTPNLWADTSQVDAVQALGNLMKSPWKDRVVFGSHAPLFIAESAFLRVVPDLDDDAAQQVLSKNAEMLLERGNA